MLLPMSLQQCSDAIKRAQILKEKMGLPKTLSTPAAQMCLPAAQQIHADMSSSASLQDNHAREGSLLERQSSLPSQPPVSGTVIGKAVSMPAGSGSILRAYAAGALQDPVEEGQENEPSSPQRHVLGEIGNGHDGVEMPLIKTKPKGLPSSAALSNKLDRIAIKEAHKASKAAWI
ncbi:hypothetical protein ABBQ32_009583 [Trebouxia sp. C0010 RCD-2024]